MKFGLLTLLDESRERFAEGIEIIDKAWRQETLTYQGRYRTVQDLPVLPHPVQQPRPPIWIGAGPTPEVYELAAARGYNLMLASVLAPITRFTPFVQLYRDRLREAGHDLHRSQLKRCSTLFVPVAGARGAARASA
jgi:alkanesulfonate monooxygenase SsuD/methylene tetrahydromethanopterin reductase-like flavin-dependent oxidoreductase (luciferase family)